MKKHIWEIQKNALMIFDDEEYQYFCTLLEQNKINAARLYLENKMESVDNDEIINNDFIYNQLQDMLIDLIVNEVDGGEREFKPIKTTE